MSRGVLEAPHPQTQTSQAPGVLPLPLGETRPQPRGCGEAGARGTRPTAL